MTAGLDEPTEVRAERARIVAHWQLAAAWVSEQLLELHRIEGVTPPNAIRTAAIRARFDRPDR